MGVNFGGARYYTNKGNEYDKTNFFKKVGTFVGTMALVPGTLQLSKKYDIPKDIFTKLVKEGPGANDKRRIAKMFPKREGIRKFFQGCLEKFPKGKFGRVSVLVGGLAIATGAVIGACRLAGGILDGIINIGRRNRADRRASA